MSDTPADLVRLSKRMSELGLCSRREADEWISKGWVKVDGQVVSELGSKVRPDQKITIDRKAQDQQNERVTIIPTSRSAMSPDRLRTVMNRHAF